MEVSVNDIPRRIFNLPVQQAVSFRPDCSTPANRAEVTRCMSRLEIIAAGARRLAPLPAGQLLGLLLGTTVTEFHSGSEVLYPLWAEERMHRAYNMVRLCQMLACARPHGPVHRLSGDIQCALARDLASQYRSLVGGGDYEIVPCSAILRGIVSNLVELFGSVREVQFRTKIEPVSLPAYRRRALMLAASELVINAMRHAFKGRRQGQIVVALRILGDQHARLTVADDGVGCDIGPVEAERGVAGGLASVLEANLVYGPYCRAGTVSEITFPTHAVDEVESKME
jgi:hypothetical protein